MNLKQKVITGVKWTSLSSITIAILQILQISILARYLSPEDFGLMAIVIVVIGFSRIFSDMGISNAIIHNQNTTSDQLSSLYWLNIASGLFLFLVIVSLSSYIADFYSQPKLINLLMLLASIFVVLSIGNQYRVLFQKDLQFDIMAKIEITAAVMAFNVAIVLAVKGFGVYALAYATLTNAMISSILFLILGLKKHKPSFIYKHSEIKKYLGFGMFQMGDNTLNYFNSQIDVILIGKFLGAETLGIYAIAKQLVMRPFQIINPILTKVAFPTMAKVQNNPEKLKNIYLKIIDLLGTINFPIYAFIILFAHEIVFVMFGEQWIEAVPIIQILALSVALITIGNPVGSLLLAKGKVNWGFYWNLMQLLIIPIVIYFASFGGILTVAWSIVVLKAIFVIPSWYILINPLIGVSLIAYILKIMTPFVITIISFSVSHYLVELLVSPIIKVFLGGSVLFILYASLTFLVNRNIFLYSFNLIRKGK